MCPKRKKINIGFVVLTPLVCADVKPWKELVRSQHKVWVTYDVEVSKGQADSIGMTFKDVSMLLREVPDLSYDPPTPRMKP